MCHSNIHRAGSLRGRKTSFTNRCINNPIKGARLPRGRGGRPPEGRGSFGAIGGLRVGYKAPAARPLRGHRVGEPAGPAGLWKAPSPAVPSSFFSLFRRRSGWFVRQQQEEASQGQLSKSPSPAPFSFQFNDQTSAWKKGEGARGTERSCACMSKRVRSPPPPARPSPAV